MSQNILWYNFIMVENLEKYVAAFAEVLGVDPQSAGGLRRGESKAWDSVGHMGLVARLEDAFGIVMRPDDILDFLDFESGRRILRDGYGIGT